MHDGCVLLVGETEHRLMLQASWPPMCSFETCRPRSMPKLAPRETGFSPWTGQFPSLKVPWCAGVSCSKLDHLALEHGELFCGCLMIAYIL